MSVINNIKKTIRYGRKNGFMQAFYTVEERMQQNKVSYSYCEPDESVLEVQRKYVFLKPHMFSILVPAYETKPKFMRALVDSVLAQTYASFELIIADASSSDVVENTVAEYVDHRIRYIRLRNNGGISMNTNEAMQYAVGEYCALLDHDDILTPDALYEMAFAIEQSERAGIKPAFLYSDEDKCNGDESYYFSPHYKFDFNYELLLSNNYICHFLVVDTALLKKVTFRKEYDGAQDFDLVLRLVEELLKDSQKKIECFSQILHIPKILYHWRCHSDSTADNPESKMYAYEAGKSALQDYCNRQGWHVEVRHGMHLGFYDILYQPESTYWEQRQDVGVVGGLLLKRKEIVAGAYTDADEILYKNLSSHFAGYMNRAHLCQDIEAVDIRCMRVAPRWQMLYKEITGLAYQDTLPSYENDKQRLQGVTEVLRAKSSFCDMTEEEIREKSLRFCQRVRAAGERIVLDPKRRIRL